MTEIRLQWSCAGGFWKAGKWMFPIKSFLLPLSIFTGNLHHQNFLSSVSGRHPDHNRAVSALWHRVVHVLDSRQTDWSASMCRWRRGNRNLWGTKTLLSVKELESPSAAVYSRLLAPPTVRQFNTLVAVSPVNHRPVCMLASVWQTFL